MFITFEGAEGVGKSTQIKLLQQHLERVAKSVVLTREPGGTQLAEKLRSILLENEGIKDALIEYLILATARRDHILKVIEPSLKAGKWVLCDRFYDSSIVYQGMLKGLDLNLMERLHTEINNSLFPDMTIVLDIEPESSNQRLVARTEELTHYDTKDISFHKSVREGFLFVAKQNQQRVHVIDAHGSVDDVHARIIKLLEPHLQG
jgi:dTMP kinase